MDPDSRRIEAQRGGGSPSIFLCHPEQPHKFWTLLFRSIKLGEWSFLNEHCETPSSLSKSNWSLSVVPMQEAYLKREGLCIQCVK
jgi:hypothetical protein